MKNILICVTGLTPQIVTETLFCLAVKEKVPVDELYIITTLRGREVILGRDKASQTPKVPLINEIVNLCSKYKVKKPKFENDNAHIIVAKEESLELSDIRTDKHNILFPNKVCEFIKTISAQPDTTLNCSISGGRKTMSVHLAFALTLFGRENDRLLHVLTSEENEFKDFYPVNKKEAKELELSEIPYVRLRSLISSTIKEENFLSRKYSDIVKFTQKQLKIIYDKRLLLLDINTQKVKYGNQSIKLEPLEFALYFKFVEAKLEGKNKYSIHEMISPEFAIQVAEFIKDKFEHYYFGDAIKKPWWKTGFSAEGFRSKRSKINEKLESLISDPDYLSNFRIESERQYRETRYFIKAEKSKFKISY
ncbi:MAG: CRISPR-associated protein [Ignavibacteria bacterium RIFOXYB2_FULL_35_12]|nr:MAG: CRISPR-associated protein [Ignavibacteria bacterium GWA2_36_19]OGU56280.1 MAG: CRISPR-associated protein [Ignavibacteria bacterium GWF2_35_20]OGU88187.1 MAG: CRISPR-associated protein [Ignavibacteria bacterium RIFOXYA12_FULL_35_25]OGU95984.1 MAG: CRISPR-associated protein [Ignavibacteria bacterium RIFOXYB12_FULL_35_14]OGU99347.1 MAG: CRISPR-associated protein [Ignavibacteria bacterium RIFOXYC2_FULL_35_16]OGV02715.1 MAG: CRISPR-associated protein [Ignavibacteria bacterium RIFOXYB2_FULL_